MALRADGVGAAMTRPCRDRRSRLYATARVVVCLLALAVTAGGCASKKIALRSTPNSPLVEQYDLVSFDGPKPSQRTLQLLRVHNLADEDFSGDMRPLLVKMQAINDAEPSSEIVFAMSELAFLGGVKAQRFDKQIALDLYYASVLHAYDYLFDMRYYAMRNPYDPQYRRACDLYNGSLEAALRIVCAEKALLPGLATTITTAAGEWDITCMLCGSPITASVSSNPLKKSVLGKSGATAGLSSSVFPEMPTALLDKPAVAPFSNRMLGIPSKRPVFNLARLPLAPFLGGRKISSGSSSSRTTK